MKNFVIAKYDQFEGRMYMRKVQADNAIEALKTFLGVEDFNSIDELEGYAFDCDTPTSIIEI